MQEFLQMDLYGCSIRSIERQHLQHQKDKFNETAPDEIKTTYKKGIDAVVESDIDNKVGKEYGIVFQLLDGVAKIYGEKFNLDAYNGNEDNELPLAATYIIGQDGIIEYAFLDADYRNRANPEDLVAFLKNGK